MTEESASPRPVAVVGAGRWGQNLLRVVLEQRALTLSAVVELDRDRAREAARRVPGVPVVASLAEVEAALEGVLVATPATTHVEVALAALEQGAHVLVEKPVALSVRGVEALAQAARAARRCVMAGHLLRYHAGIRELGRRVRAGEVGRVTAVVSRRLGTAGGLERDCDAWWCLAPHDLSVVLGELGLRVRAVALSERLVGRFSAELRLSGGATAALDVSLTAAEKTRTLRVEGERGWIGLDDARPSVVVGGHGTERWEHQVPWEEPLAVELRHFAELLAVGAPPRTSLDEALQVTRCLEAGVESLRRRGAWVTVGAPRSAPRSLGPTAPTPPRA